MCYRHSEFHHGTLRGSWRDGGGPSEANIREASSEHSGQQELKLAAGAMLFLTNKSLLSEYIFGDLRIAVKKRSFKRVTMLSGTLTPCY